MRKGKGRHTVATTPARPVKHTLHFLLHGEGNETVQGTLILDNFPLHGNMGVGGMSTPVQPGDEKYDEAGASVYAIVVIAVYGFSIVMLIASHIFLKKKADKRDGGDEKQIDKYLAQVPSLKEKSQRDSFRRLKKSIIPLLSMGMANDITALAAGPLGPAAFRRHMDLLEQQRLGMSPSRSPSMGHPSGDIDSPTGDTSPRTVSPSFDESSVEDLGDGVKLDMTLERDRSFDRVSQSRMPIIVEIDEATDSPTAPGAKHAPSSCNNKDSDRDLEGSVISQDCSVSIESPNEYHMPEGHLTVNPLEPNEGLLEAAAGITSSSQPDAAKAGSVLRKCHPSKLAFDIRSVSKDDVAGPSCSEGGPSQGKTGSGKRGSLPKWNIVSSLDSQHESSQQLEESEKISSREGIQITFV